MPQINSNISEETKNRLQEFLTDEKNKEQYKSQNNFVDRAINTLIDIEEQGDNQFLNIAIQTQIENTIHMTEKRLGDRFASLLFSTAISLDIIMEILETNFSFTASEIEMMRADAVARIQETKSMRDFRNLVSD